MVTGVEAINAALRDDGFFGNVYGGPVSMNLTAAGWIKANKDQSGYYRVLYPKQFWVHLSAAITTQLASGGPSR